MLPTKAPASPTEPLPGFWRVPPGMLVEPGDTTLDALGEPQHLPLEQVGLPVTDDLVVLRLERRKTPR